MRTFRFDPGTVHLLRLDTDDDLYDTITGYVKRHHIEAAWVTFLGAVKRASLRYYDQERKAYVDFSIDEPLEVVAGVGNVSVLDGEPFLHIHAALADESGAGRGGHVNSGTIVFALEVSIQVLDGEAPVRLPDDCTGLTLW
jgi:predicted DNA-binding protein with PD1-like motif